ncbi:2-nitropropane dioxygenase [Flagelloscypha sp. PMI_526]|nr:2-nitropropane dioxygenase [Flagelloscypha sp. PMI_526]
MPSRGLIISTPLTKLFGIDHPVMLAGMDRAAGPGLAAAVTNAGGIGVIGGWLMKPRILKITMDALKEELEDPNAPFGVDLLVPKVGESARKTNKDYTDGQMPELVDTIIAGGAKLFVGAVGVTPKWVVDKFHAAGIPVMNMVGHPKHVKNCLDVGVDLICAQGGEAGGHTGDIPTSILLPSIVDEVNRLNGKSSLTGNRTIVVGAGGVYDGRGLASCLSYGAAGVWVGTRFVASIEAGAPEAHKQALVNAGYDDVIRTTFWTGRPAHTLKLPKLIEWETTRREEHAKLLSEGKIPYLVETEKDPSLSTRMHAYPMGKVSGSIHEVKPAKEIVDDIVLGAVATMSAASALIVGRTAKL